MEQRTLRAMQELARLLCDDADNPSQDEVHARLKGFVVHETAQRQPKQQSKPQGFSAPVAGPETYSSPHDDEHADIKWRLGALQNQFEGLEKRSNGHASRLFELEQSHEDTKERLGNTEELYRHLNELQRQVDGIGAHVDTHGHPTLQERLDRQSKELHAYKEAVNDLTDTVRELEAKVNRLPL